MAAKPLSKSRTRSGAPPGCLGLFFSVFLFAGLAMLWFMLLKPVSRLWQAQSWTPVPCTILESHVEESNDSDGGSTYKPVVWFSYSHQGRDHRSNQYNFLDYYSSGRAGKQAVVDRYPPGASETCYVDPEDPSQAVLDRGFTPGYLVGLFSLLFLLPGLGGVIWVVGSRFKGESLQTGVRIAPEKAFGVENPQGDDDGPVELRPKATPLGQLVAILLISLFWNGIVWFVAWHMYSDWQTVGLDGCAAIFISVFLLVGLLLIFATVRQFLVLFNPRPRLTLSPGSLTPGGTAYLQWRLTGATGGLQRFRVTLEGVEEARYRRGTDTNTDRETFSVFPLVESTDPYQISGGASATIHLPPEAPPSFAAGNNKILWVIKAVAEVKGWPDSTEEFEVLVRPRR